MIMFFSRNGKLLMNLDLYSSFGYFDGYKDLRSYLSYGIQRSEPTRYHQQQTYMFDKIDINQICIHLLFLISFKFCTLLIKCQCFISCTLVVPISILFYAPLEELFFLLKLWVSVSLHILFIYGIFIQFDQYILKDE